MTLNDARNAAKAWSEGQRALVVKADKGEVRSGYYFERDGSLVPHEQVVAAYENGKEVSK